MIENAGLNKGLNVIDIGGGSGYISLSCAKRGCTCYHVDLDSDSILEARRIANQYDANDIVYIIAVAENLQFIPDEVMDVVFCGEVMEHLKKEEPAIREAYRILKPSGKYIITTPNYNALPYILLRLIPNNLKNLLFKIFKINLGLHAKILSKTSYEASHLEHQRVGYTRKELESKLKSNGFVIEKSMRFGFLMPRLIASKMPPIVYKLLYNLGSVLSPIASKHLIVAKKK
jgi:ubiquinone/menaquinone biosynthesis C-methylase UbiE